MDLSRSLILKGSLETTAQESLRSVLPQICAMNSSLKRAYGYVEEARMALGKKRREKAAITIESEGVFVAEFSILPLLFLGAISSTARTSQTGSNGLETLFPITGERN